MTYHEWQSCDLQTEIVIGSMFSSAVSCQQEPSLTSVIRSESATRSQTGNPLAVEGGDCGLDFKAPSHVKLERCVACEAVAS